MPKRVDEGRILDAAADMLVARGYAGATTKAIADASGINEVTLFRRFGSKAALFARAIDRRLAAVPLSRVSFTGDLEGDLQGFVEAYIETNETHGDIVAVILTEIPRNPELRSLLHTPWSNLQGVMELLQRYQRTGKLEAESPLTALSALVGPLMISQMFRRANARVRVPVVDPRAHVAAFLNGRKA